MNPNGVDLEAYRPLDDEQRTILRSELGFEPDDVVLGFCGTFGGWHGIEVLADAIPRIAAERPEARFLLVGGGNFKHLVTAKIEEAGIASKVHDAGMVSQADAAELLPACDIFLSPHSKHGNQTILWLSHKTF